MPGTFDVCKTKIYELYFIFLAIFKKLVYVVNKFTH